MGTRGGAFVYGDPHDAPMPMDYFVWVIRNDERGKMIPPGAFLPAVERYDLSDKVDAGWWKQPSSGW